MNPLWNQQCYNILQRNRRWKHRGVGVDLVHLGPVDYQMDSKPHYMTIPTSCFQSGTNSPVSFEFSSGGSGVPICTIIVKPLVNVRATHQAKVFSQSLRVRLNINPHCIELLFESAGHRVTSWLTYLWPKINVAGACWRFPCSALQS